ncbi:MAG: hypothetical protein KDB90_01460 [Planctomycetes bacterium]|nr:hypothetical protein [Planctomycetota bacterium]
MKGRVAALLGPGTGLGFLLVAVLAGWSVPVAFVGGGLAMLTGALGGLAFKRLGTRDKETSEQRDR